MTDIITCPVCRHDFPISQAMAGQFREELKSELDKRLTEESVKIKEAARETAKNELAIELIDLHAKAEESAKKLRTFQEQELGMRKKVRELEEQKQGMALEMTRQLDQERRQIELETTKRILEERRLVDMEKEKKLTDLQVQVEDLNHKLKVGSQQSHGEIQELGLEETLRAAFTSDEITPVGKGVLGADVIQHVRNRNGKLCDKIVWESKRVRHWNDQWVTKLKDDSRKMGGFVSIIVSAVLPEGLDGFGYYNGIWVTDYRSTIGLATALRQQIIYGQHVHDSMSGKEEKLSMMFDYLTGQQFRSRIEAIIETFQSMRSDLDKEKEAMRRLWAKREKEILRITENTIGMYGEMQGLIGSSMPSLPALDLTAISEGRDDETEN